MSRDGAHLAVTAALHDALNTVAEAVGIPPIVLDEVVLDDVLLAYDSFQEAER